MIPNVYFLGDGMTLRVYRTEKFKTGMLSLSLALPIHRDTVWKTSLLLSVLRRGTEKYPTLAHINRRLDYLYGTELAVRNSYCADTHVIGFSAEILEDAYLIDGGESLLCGVLDVMREILFHPLLDETGCLLARYVESEKQLQCDHIRARKNHPRSYAMQRASELLYEKEPCGAPIYGTEAEILAVTAEELTAHWKMLLTQLRPECFYVGSAGAEQLRRVLNDSIGAELRALPKHTLPARSAPMLVRSAEEIRREEETLPVSQGQLVLALRAGAAITDAEFYATAVYNELLGVSPISKLFMEVREKQSLCYHCSSSYNANKGTVLINCGIESANRERAEAEILRQLRLLAAGDFSDAELDAAKKSILNAYRLLDDSPADIERYYFGRGLMGVSDSVELARERVAAIDREDVIEAAKRVTVDVIYFLRGTLQRGEDEDDELE